MRAVALVSGGKDSCYSMLQCVAAGHTIVALANVRPDAAAVHELDSYMYQSVGHEAVQLYAEAMGLPLFRRHTRGLALQQQQLYTATPEDEVEDLYQLLRTVKDQVDVDAVAVGAILSDYQRIRVENVCSRLGLVALAYLWRRDQQELLQEMIECKVNAIIIKVAALGLCPARHLGMSLAELQPHITRMKEKYGLNICGEGGEYETFTLDCPLFLKTIVIDEWETVIHSNDAIAPVGYLNLKRCRLVEKDCVNAESTFLERISGVPVKTWRDLIVDLDEDVTEDKLVGRGENGGYSEEPPDGEEADVTAAPCPEPLQALRGDVPLPDLSAVSTNEAGWTWFGGVTGQGEDCASATKQALQNLHALLSKRAMTMSDVVAVSLYVRDMNHYASINAEYVKVFKDVNPPVRMCVEAPLPAGTSVVLEGLGFCSPSEDVEKHTMHVQGISHWAPANIGPYSQAVRVGDIIYVAGQIALVPGTMQLLDGGARKQCRLALRHVGRIFRAMDSNTQLRDVVQGICYVTHPSYIPEARREWEKRTNNAIVDYVVVSQLPRAALLEWHVWAHRHNNSFEYEETGCCIGNWRVSIRRRWNYENDVSAVVCYVSSATPNTNAEVSVVPEEMSDDHLSQVICYALAKLLRNAPPSTVCSLRFFCKVGEAPAPEAIGRVLGHTEGFDIVYSIVPVCELFNEHTVLSICGVRHN